MRVEGKTVFDDTHRLILELVRTGRLTVYVSIISTALPNPAYLARLRQEVGPACFYMPLTVEKFSLRRALPDDWPVSGTTGYEFIASLAEVLVDDEQMNQSARGLNR